MTDQERPLAEPTRVRWRSPSECLAAFPRAEDVVQEAPLIANVNASALSWRAATQHRRWSRDRHG
jgi:hypothetical protein